MTQPPRPPLTSRANVVHGKVEERSGPLRSGVDPTLDHQSSGRCMAGTLLRLRSIQLGPRSRDRATNGGSAHLCWSIRGGVPASPMRTCVPGEGTAHERSASEVGRGADQSEETHLATLTCVSKWAARWIYQSTFGLLWKCDGDRCLGCLPNLVEFWS